MKFIKPILIFFVVLINAQSGFQILDNKKKIEMDRRLIKDRITQLNRELEDVKAHREVTRQARGKVSSTVVAIVGYTNAGKSTLLNKLSL